MRRPATLLTCALLLACAGEPAPAPIDPGNSGNSGGGGAGGSGAGNSGGAGGAPLPHADGCADPFPAAWLARLRAPTPGQSRLAAPGATLAELRRCPDVQLCATLEARSRAQLAGGDPTLAFGDTGALQTFASRALAAAWLAAQDDDDALAERALLLLQTAAVDEAFLQGAHEPAITAGGSLLASAAAVDLLELRDPEAPRVARAKEALGRTARAVDAWYRGEGAPYLLLTRNNHNVRLGAGLAAAALVLEPAELSDEVLAAALAELANVADVEMASGEDGWAEGPTYFGYALELGAPAWSAIDAAWPLAGPGCARCPEHVYAPCGEAVTVIRRPSEDAALQASLRWAASLTTAGGWLAPVDDSRLAGVPGPLLERLAGARIFPAYALDVQGALGGSVDVGPLVALAALQAPSREEPLRAVWELAGSARLEARTPEGLLLQSFLFAEREQPQRGRGHERPDPLSIVLAVDGLYLLGASGYGHYAERAELSTPQASSLITLDGTLPRSSGLVTPGPTASLRLQQESAIGATGVDESQLERRLRFEADGALLVEDRVTLAVPASIERWFHLRGALVTPEGTAWEVDGVRCEATEAGALQTLEHREAPHVDLYDQPGLHPVLLLRTTAPAGLHTFLTTIRCRRP